MPPRGSTLAGSHKPLASFRQRLHFPTNHRFRSPVWRKPNLSSQRAAEAAALPPGTPYQTMSPDQFWISQDGQIISVKEKSAEVLSLTAAFKFKSPEEMAFARSQLASLQFSERSSLARIGIEMVTIGEPVAEHRRILLELEAFIFDKTFPSTPFFQYLLRPGTPVGRLFFAPESAKLSSDEIWRALRENRIKLPSTISVDRFGSVFLTPHKVRYTLVPELSREQLERVVSGEESREFLDKAQIRQEAEIVSIPPHSGTLTSCSMYLSEHYVVLNRGEGNFGIHSGAVLLDPLKTFGTNVMLEIYNRSDQLVVNPVVSVEIYRAAILHQMGKSLQLRRRDMLSSVTNIYRCLDAHSPHPAVRIRPKTRISVRGQTSVMENHSRLVAAGNDFREVLQDAPDQACGYQTLIQALDASVDQADTLIVDFLPNLLEHIELLTRVQQLALKQIVFRNASRSHGFFLSSDAHARLDTYNALGIKVYWYNEPMKDLFLHAYKKGHGFFVREETVTSFLASTILAFYGSAVDIDPAQAEKIQQLIERLTHFFGPSVGILTGGGGGVMGSATTHARQSQAIVGACFLELESQPPNFAVDFFNSFQETSRHNRQKWFEVADFCIFNVGGVGTLEEVGIELCNLKLGIRRLIPHVFFNAAFWQDLKAQLATMIRTGRAPAWISDYVLFSDDPEEVVAFYRRTLQIL